MSVEKLRLANEAFGDVMMQLYGQTECLMAITALTREDHADIRTNPALGHRIASAGRAGPFSHVEIMDDDGQIIADDRPGEIVCRTGLLMLGWAVQRTDRALFQKVSDSDLMPSRVRDIWNATVAKSALGIDAIKAG